MYTRVPSGRMPRGMRVPENYGGNAFRSPSVPPAYGERSFREPPSPPPKEDPIPPPFPDEALPQEGSVEDTTHEEDAPSPPQEEIQNTERDTDEASVPTGSKTSPFGLRLPFLQGRSQGLSLSIGFEELLLIGLILLISQDGKNDDLVWLLLLLLLIP